MGSFADLLGNSSHAELVNLVGSHIRNAILFITHVHDRRCLAMRVCNTKRFAVLAGGIFRRIMFRLLGALSLRVDCRFLLLRWITLHHHSFFIDEDQFTVLTTLVLRFDLDQPVVRGASSVSLRFVRAERQPLLRRLRVCGRTTESVFCHFVDFLRLATEHLVIKWTQHSYSDNINNYYSTLNFIV